MTRRADDSDECCGHFRTSYQRDGLPAMLALERQVLGSDYGGTSWTTRTQAETAVTRLGLDADHRLLDVGAGAGWPALLFTELSGCQATLIDIELSGLATAAHRARRDGLQRRVRTLAASGSQLPVTDGSHTTLAHWDVLCCLPDKLATLRECRRAAVTGASMVFTVIDLAAGLRGADRRRAVELGPPYVENPTGYPALLAASGWELRDRTSLTADYAHSLRAMVDGLEVIPGLREAMGADDWRQSRLRRREQLAAVDEGLLVRELYRSRAA